MVRGLKSKYTQNPDINQIYSFLLGFGKLLHRQINTGYKVYKPCPLVLSTPAPPHHNSTLISPHLFLPEATGITLQNLSVQTLSSQVADVMLLLDAVVHVWSVQKCPKEEERE